MNKNNFSIVIDDPRFLPKQKTKKKVSKKLYKQMNANYDNEVEDFTTKEEEVLGE